MKRSRTFLSNSHSEIEQGGEKEATQTQPKSNLALWGVPSLGHCGVAPRPCAAVGTPPSSRLALTSNLGLQIVNFIV